MLRCAILDQHRDAFEGASPLSQDPSSWMALPPGRADRKPHQGAAPLRPGPSVG
jgi:hypothetical protein